MSQQSEPEPETAGPVHLTKHERWALGWAINDQIDGGHGEHPTVKEVIKVLRGLLARATVSDTPEG